MRLVFCLVLVLATTVLAGCSGGSQAGVSGGFVAGDGSDLIPPAKRQQAPAISAPTLAGEQLSLAAFEGSPVVVNFWASWCGPCKREAPDLKAVAENPAFDEAGVRLVGVDVKDSRANARSFVRDYDLPYPSWYDQSASIAAKFGGIGPAALPTTLVLDAQHRVAARLFGAVTTAQLSGVLESVLEASSGAASAAPTLSS
jgi:thiol-disulfide isomerase/thioredoxin